MPLENRYPVIFLVLFCPLFFFGQSSPDFKPIQGVMLQPGATVREGVWQAAVRTGDNQVIPFTFDARVVIERGSQVIAPKDLVPGERLSVFLAEASGSALRRAEAIRVLLLSDLPAATDAHCGAERDVQHPIWSHHLFPDSGIAVAGVIEQCDGSHLRLHTRNGENRTVILSPNTRYFENGVSVGPDRLLPNTRVFIRAEKNLLSDLEADQVIWGRILRPR